MKNDWKSRLHYALWLAELVSYWVAAHIRACLMGKHVKALLCQSQNGLIAVPPLDFQTGRRLAYLGRYDFAPLQQLLPLITDRSHVVVVGTHIGAMLVPLAKQAGAVDTVEANPAIYPFIETNLLMNGLNNVRVHHLAAGEEDGVAEFLQNRVDSAQSRLKPRGGSRFEFTYDRPLAIQVPVQRLDSIIDGGEIEVMLVNVSGGEFFVLKGAQGVLTRTRNLQLSIVPNHIDHVAKVDRKDFIGLVGGHFSHAKVVLDGVQKDYARDQFYPMMDEIYDQAYLTGWQVLFSK